MCGASPGLGRPPPGRWRLRVWHGRSSPDTAAELQYRKNRKPRQSAAPDSSMRRWEAVRHQLREPSLLGKTGRSLFGSIPTDQRKSVRPDVVKVADCAFSPNDATRWSTGRGGSRARRDENRPGRPRGGWWCDRGAFRRRPRDSVAPPRAREPRARAVARFVVARGLRVPGRPGDVPAPAGGPDGGVRPGRGHDAHRDRCVQPHNRAVLRRPDARAAHEDHRGGGALGRVRDGSSNRRRRGVRLRRGFRFGRHRLDRHV